jgi:hypothetical protein
MVSIGDPMSDKEDFLICGKKMVLPPTPEPIDLSWEKMKGKKGRKKITQTPVTPRKKRFRLRKKKKD